MGQKVNPHGIRVGVIKDWDSRWFASKKDFSDNLVEDHKIRTELKAQLKDAGVPKIEIERTVDPSTSAPRVTVNIYCAKPGMVIGKGGEERVALQNKLTKEYGKTVIVNVIEVKSASTNAQLVAEDIAYRLYLCLSWDCNICRIFKEPDSVLDTCGTGWNVSGWNSGVVPFIFYKNHSCRKVRRIFRTDGHLRKRRIIYGNNDCKPCIADNRKHQRRCRHDCGFICSRHYFVP